MRKKTSTQNCNNFNADDKEDEDEKKEYFEIKNLNIDVISLVWI